MKALKIEPGKAPDTKFFVLVTNSPILFCIEG